MNWRWTLVAFVGLFLIVAFRYLLKRPKPQPLAGAILVNSLRVAGQELLAVTPCPHSLFDPHALQPQLAFPANAGDPIMVGFTNPNWVDVEFVTSWMFEYSDGMREMVTMRGDIAAGKSGAFSRFLPRGGLLLRVIMTAEAR